MSPENKTAAELSSIFTQRLLAMYPLSVVNLVQVDALGLGRWRATTFSADMGGEMMSDVAEILQAMKLEYRLA